MTAPFARRSSSALDRETPTQLKGENVDLTAESFEEAAKGASKYRYTFKKAAYDSLYLHSLETLDGPVND